MFDLTVFLCVLLGFCSLFSVTALLILIAVVIAGVLLFNEYRLWR